MRERGEPLSARQNVRVWRCLTVWRQMLDRLEGAPWMNTTHMSLTMQPLRVEADASGRRWGGVLRSDMGSVSLSVGEEFRQEHMACSIMAKEAMAVLWVLQQLVRVKGEALLAGARVNVFIDNSSVVLAMLRGASKEVKVHEVLESLFWLKLRLGCVLTPIWWGTKENAAADAITRVSKADDWRLDRQVFLELWRAWGPFQMDLMASSVNVQRDVRGRALPFFSRYCCAGSAGVDLLAQPLSPGRYYCFPHQRMVSALVAYLACRPGASVVVVVRLGGMDACLPRLHAAVCAKRKLLPEGCVGSQKGRVPEQFEAWLLCF